MFIDFFKLSLRNIRHRKRRSWLTVLGVMIGVLAIVALISIGQGLENSVQSEIKQLGGDKVFITPGGGRMQRFTGTSEKLENEDINSINNAKGVKRSIGLVTGNIVAEYRDETAFIDIRSGPVQSRRELFMEIEALKVKEGRFLRPADTNSIVLTENSAEDTFEEELKVGSRIKINEQDFRVVGIVSKGLSRSGGAYLTLDKSRVLLNKSDGYDAVVAEVQEGLEPRDVEENIRKKLRRSRDVKKGEEDFSTTTAADIIRSFNNQLAIIRGVLLGIGAISLLVGAVGIMNTMYTAVTQRTKEIGLMKAIGATRRQIMALFMIESGIIGAVGGIVGVVIGVAVSRLASGIISETIGLQYRAYIGVDLLVGGVLFAFTVGVISGVLPARKASKLKPAEALSY